MFLLTLKVRDRKHLNSKVRYNINNQGSKEYGAAVPLSVYTKARHKSTSWERPEQIVRFSLEKEIVFTEYDKKCVHTSPKNIHL